MAYIGPGLPGVAQPAPAPPAAPPASTASASQLSQIELARKIAAEILNPQKKAAQSILTAADNAALNTRGAYDALAQMRQGQVGDVQQAYQTAAGSTAAFSKGYSDAMQAKVNGQAQDINSFLEKMGAPSGAMLSTSGSAGDVVYGLTGEIPASALAAQGAAAGAYAAGLPGQAKAAGIAAGNVLLGKGQQAYADSLSAIAAKAPSVVDSALTRVQKAQSAVARAEADAVKEVNRHKEKMAKARTDAARAYETRRHNRAMEAISNRNAASNETRANRTGTRSGGSGGGNGVAGAGANRIKPSTAISNKKNDGKAYDAYGNEIPGLSWPKKGVNTSEFGRLSLDYALDTYESTTMLKGGTSRLTADEAAEDIAGQLMVRFGDKITEQQAMRYANAAVRTKGTWKESAPPAVADQPPAPSAATSDGLTYKLGKSGIFVYDDPREASGNNSGAKIVRRISPGDPGWAEAVARAIDPATMKPLSPKAIAALTAVN